MSELDGAVLIGCYILAGVHVGEPRSYPGDHSEAPDVMPAIIHESMAGFFRA